MNWNIFLLIVLLFTACEKSETCETERNFSFDFNNSLNGWQAGFADYPLGEEVFYELNSEYNTLPAPLDQSKKAFMVAGNNHSDDLFMYIKKQVDGLLPSANYSFTFKIELASNAFEGSAGIGGSPAHSVYVKSGATAIEPERVLDNTDNHYRMNIDKGNQANEGTEMINLGDMSNGTNESEYVLIERNSYSATFLAHTDSSGRIWLIFGLDSGFEGKTTTYITKILVTATLEE